VSAANAGIFQKGFFERRIVPTFDFDFGEILAGGWPGKWSGYSRPI
jgi:hypothetical protein